MNILLTPITYWLLIVMWAFILFFYIKRLKILKQQSIALHQSNEQLKKEIRERKRVETALRETQDQHHAILNNTANVIFIKDIKLDVQVS